MTNRIIAIIALLFLGFFAVSQTTQAEAGGIPEEAMKHMYRGQAAMEVAKDVADFQDAIGEYKKAIRYAPKWADAWFNLGVAQEKAGNYADAITSFRKYLDLSPKAPDSNQVKGRIYKLEYKQEKAAQQQAEEVKKSERIDLSGDWCRVVAGNVFCESIKIKTSGNSFDILLYFQPDNYYYHTGRWDTWFRCRLDGDRITGSFYVDPIICPNMGTKVTGRVIDQDKIELNVLLPSFFGPDAPNPNKRCTVSSTTPIQWGMVRKH